MNRKTIASFALPAAVLVWLGVYLLSAVTDISMGARLSLVFALAIGPLGMIGCLELGRFLDPDGASLLSRAAKAFGVCAFAIWEAVMVVQKGAGGLIEELGARSPVASRLPDPEAALWLARQSTNATQASMDVAFDVFYTLAVLLFSVLMLRDRRFGVLVGAFGVLASAALLTLNLWTFPLPPANAGLVDFGPLTGVWWVIVIILWIRADRAVAEPEAARARVP